MSEDKLQKKVSENVKERAQYVLAFGVIATMLVVAQFPMFVIIFFGIFAYFLWRTFSQPPVSGVRAIFDFYVDANNILRDDERRFFGYEVNDVISRGEMILRGMNGAPPLVYFAVGALYNRVGNHEAAVSYLSRVLEEDAFDEIAYKTPTPELRNYVQALRKVESHPKEAPLSAAAVTALERARRTRGKAMLENSRSALEQAAKQLSENQPTQLPAPEIELKNAVFITPVESAQTKPQPPSPTEQNQLQDLHFLDISDFPIDGSNTQTVTTAADTSEEKDPFVNRKPISEVLRDIYD